MLLFRLHISFLEGCGRIFGQDQLAVLHVCIHVRHFFLLIAVFFARISRVFPKTIYHNYSCVDLWSMANTLIFCHVCALKFTYNDCEILLFTWDQILREKQFHVSVPCSHIMHIMENTCTFPWHYLYFIYFLKNSLKPCCYCFLHPNFHLNLPPPLFSLFLGADFFFLFL